MLLIEQIYGFNFIAD